MPNKLAKLEDLKTAINANTDGADGELTTLLEAASAIAERVAGVVPGGLRRATVTDYPAARSPHSQFIGLPRRPLESVATVKLLYGPATDAEFTVQDALAEGTDFYIHAAELSVVGLFNDWWRTAERSNLITYTAGFADPDDAVGGDSIEPPEDLQRAVIIQATQLYNQRKTAGLKGVEAGGASGMLGSSEVHPSLKAAASRYWRPNP